MSTPNVAHRAPGAQAPPPMTNTDLVRATPTALEPTVEPITDPRTFQTRLDQLVAHYNVIAPPVQVLGGFVGGWTVVASIVRVNTTVNEDGQGPETYIDRGFMKGRDQRALNRVGLMKIAAAAGVKWTPQTGRRDDGRVPHLWQYYAEGVVDTPDGSYQIISGEVEIDLRDGSPQIGGWTPEAWQALLEQNRHRQKSDQVWAINGWSEKRLMQARSMGLRLSETKAKNRAIRSLGLQQVYTVKELEKPFVVFRAMYVPDTSDPVIRRMVAERALHGRQALYPAAPPATSYLAAPLPPAATLETSCAETDAPMPPVASVSSVAAAVPPRAAATGPEPSPPATAAAPATPLPLRVVAVDRRQVTRRSDGRQFTKWLVTDSNGEQHSTMSKTIGELAEKLQAEGAPIDLVTASNDYGSQIEELARASERLPFADGEGDY